MTQVVACKAFRKNWFPGNTSVKTAFFRLHHPSVTVGRHLGVTENCKYTRFSSTHFLRFRYFQLITGILPVSDYSGIHVDAPGYIPSASVP